MFGIFFTAEEAHAYANWLEWRLEQSHEPDSMPAPGVR
jgi:hypothetical protein